VLASTHSFAAAAEAEPFPCNHARGLKLVANTLIGTAHIHELLNSSCLDDYVAGGNGHGLSRSMGVVSWCVGGRKKMVEGRKLVVEGA
jgi:hypothetical protein